MRDDGGLEKMGGHDVYRAIERVFLHTPHRLVSTFAVRCDMTTYLLLIDWSCVCTVMRRVKNKIGLSWFVLGWLVGSSSKERTKERKREKGK